MADTIVFIHRNFVTRRTWEPRVARYSARGYQVVSIAYPGRDKPVKTLKADPTDSFLRTLLDNWRRGMAGGGGLRTRLGAAGHAYRRRGSARHAGHRQSTLA